MTALAMSVGFLRGDKMPPPAVEPRSLVNAASLMPATAMAGSLGRGSRFEVRGVRFSDDVDVVVRQGNQSWKASLVSTSAERIVGILPTGAAAGEATVEISRDGSSSRPYPIRIVESSFGIYSATGKGWGPASERDTGTPLPQFHPGDAVAFWGTGGGSASSGRLTVGGVPATRVVLSRSERGLGRLDFTIPKNAPIGCAVPVQAIVAGIPGNVVTLSIARQGEDCSAAEPWFARTRGEGKSAWIVLMRSKVQLELVPGERADFGIDSAMASFYREPERDLSKLTPFELIPPVGTCTSYVAHLDLNSLLLPSLVRQTVAGRDLDLGPKVAAETRTAQSLDAGAAFSLSGPNGTQQVERSIHPPHVYTALLGGNPPFTRIEPKPMFLSPGEYVAHITGGSDIGAFDARIHVGKTIEWTNEKAVSELRRRPGSHGAMARGGKGHASSGGGHQCRSHHQHGGSGCLPGACRRWRNEAARGHAREPAAHRRLEFRLRARLRRHRLGSSKRARADSSKLDPVGLSRCSFR